jgi:hypothetical protein
MGARGKKRKRANGSIAHGQQTNTYTPSNRVIDEPVAEVPVEAIREIMPFMLDSRDASDSELEEGGFAFERAMREVSDRHDLEDDALEFRATRLGWLVESWRPDLLKRHPDGTPSIDPRILEFAATFDPRKPETMIQWVAEEFPKAE